ncbi:phage replisome organizer N-terminal domain-containing protein [Lysinibacillus telephonicus]|uniref:phage replisome organizer N-terminal domain-containing protein n=1 Tax=Lysinibacillus telephonicus TaxID=1714840 RepID=UPI0031FD5214
MGKKYYWLKLKEDFFRDKRIKKLRKIAGGDTYTIIYLKMQLLSLKDEGILYYEGVEDDFYEEIALEIDEDPENVKITIMFLIANGLLEEVEKDKYLLPETMKSIGSESSSAARVRKHREKAKALQCNTQVTDGNALVTNGNTEIETEKEIDIDIEKETDIDKEKNVGQSSGQSPVIDMNLLVIQDMFRKMIREPKPQDLSKMVEALEFYEPSLILEAIKEGSKKGKSFAYVLGILDTWRIEDKIRTYDEWMVKKGAKSQSSNNKQGIRENHAVNGSTIPNDIREKLRNFSSR